MTVRIRLPVGFERAPLPERLRYFAANLQKGGQCSQLASDLEEAATEIELGQLTETTYLGGDAR